MTTLLPALQRLARSLYFSAPSVTPRERAFLQDFARGEGRYPLLALQRLVTCSRASLKVEDRLMLSEIIRGECLAGDETTGCIATIGDAELRAEGEANSAFRSFERQRCASSREVSIAKNTVHLEHLRRLIDAMHKQ